MAETKRLTIDELLTLQTKETLLSTVEAVTDKPDFVKVTPWLPHAGCLCHQAITIPKSAIAFVTTTGNFHHCCGKKLHIAEIEFKEDATLSIAEYFRGALKNTAPHQHSHHTEREDWSFSSDMGSPVFPGAAPLAPEQGEAIYSSSVFPPCPPGFTRLPCNNNCFRIGSGCCGSGPDLAVCAPGVGCNLCRFQNPNGGVYFRHWCGACPR